MKIFLVLIVDIACLFSAQTIMWEKTIPLSADAQVMLTVFDITGREVSSLVDEKQNKGYHEAKFDGSNFID